ncbi:MAG: DUF2723 domain-containing protein [Microscillaceae bacterium]|nr:DUF2723 domain-containing protein [Microscillaceae bacterium]MDW8461843.1 DUF2723 domain-containing protein [Cytophagales bacterium]
MPKNLSAELEANTLTQRQENPYYQQFKKLNNLVAWVCFAISLVVYTLTVERTASFWDCGEFIACSYKLQVPHPPGAPFFLLTGRLFSMLAMGDVTQVAYWVNMLSVICSAFTILFLFWTITLLGLKLLPNSEQEITQNQIISLLGAGVVGSLAYTFSDSFWFSAVEAEVYAMSSFFMAIVFWAMLKWERIGDENLANRWILFIAYLTGLAIGVHLLNLTILPALGLIYYYKKHPQGIYLIPPSKDAKKSAIRFFSFGEILALSISLGIVIVIMYGIIPGLPSVAGNFEIFFVNSLGLPFGSGITFFMLAFLGSLVYGIYYSIRKQKALLNLVLNSLAFILIGYASYGIVLVRSNYNPPINENDPSEVLKFVSYLKREQYGDRPLLYGHTFASNVIGQEKGAALYRKVPEKGKYEIYDYRTQYEYDHNILFPRIYSRGEGHPELYKSIIYGSKEVPEDKLPTMGDNLYFLFKHQLGHMYFRYLLWNFVGRQSDIQDAGWLSPFESKTNVPEELARNKARNQYFALPFILGIIGLTFMLTRHKQTSLVTVMVFFLTGIALVIYLNSPPVEPRERDYIYVGSYYAFAMWIGFGVMALTESFNRYFRNRIIAPILATFVSLSVPAIMLSEGYDDHNRSNRYHSVDSARNLLNSCAPNAILFTGGDNDTFPLWYVQEVEGFRTDVRVCNLSLLGTDWYISQMKRPVYQSAALPISLEFEQYISGKNDQLLHAPSYNIETYISKEQLEALDKQGMNLKAYLNLIRKNDKLIKAYSKRTGDTDLTIFPTKKFVLPLDKQHILKLGFIPKGLDSLIKDNMVWDLGSTELYKHDLIVLDMIAHNNWQRPIYFSSTLSSSSYLGLKEYMQVEGLAFRLMPFKVEGAKQGFVNSEIMYENMTKKFFFRELDNPNTYYDENYARFILNLRSSFARLANQLIAEGKTQKAKEVLLFCLNKIPDKAIPYDVYSTQLISGLYKVEETQKADEMVKIMAKRATEMLEYLLEHRINDEVTISSNLMIMSQIISILESEGKIKEAQTYKDKFDRLYQRYKMD